MFSFDLPRFAALQVQFPTGGGSLLVHVGGGRFISKVPPIVLAGVMPAGEVAQNQEQLPVTWDGTTLPGDADAQPVFMAFDVASAQHSVEAAAQAGDTFARAVLDEIAQAQKTIDAQTALALHARTAEPETQTAEPDSIPDAGVANA